MRAELGKVYRDRITGFVGTATGRAEYLVSTAQVRLEADTGPSGDAKERWVQEGNIEEVQPPRGSGFAP